MSNTRLTLREIRHPHHVDMENDWRKYRLAFQGGRLFKEEFLEKFSTRESNSEFCRRQRMTYVPAHAKAAITDIRNSIFQRMVDITREGGPQTYQDAIAGLSQGVDGNGNTMNGFLGRIVLEELLVLGRVGIYVDKPRLNTNITLAEQGDVSPYLYHYQAEDIFSWTFDHLNNLAVVLLRDHAHIFDEDTGLITGMQERFRLLKRVWDEEERTHKVILQLFKYEDTHNSRHRHGFHVHGKAPGLKLVPDPENPPLLLDIPEIPFVIMDLSSSLMTDIADYQISLLNMASSDVSYVLKSNFPFYTEQYNPMTNLPHIRQPGNTGESTEGASANSKEINLGIPAIRC